MMAKPRKTVSELCSQRWFSVPGSVSAHKHRRIKKAGFATADFKDKPVIGILSTWADFQTCHTHFPERIEGIKGRWRGQRSVLAPAHGRPKRTIAPAKSTIANG